ncbi:MAG: glycosyltransferase family 4 protein [Candidatus Spechtbacteria bacterium]|nr:glycosyltransferase family 4 protein [Candidatus Spechtbacteria bacterium]
MKILYISSQSIERVKAAGVIQLLYTAREFERKLGKKFFLVVRKITDRSAMEREGISHFKESGCPFRARIFFYLFWLPLFLARHGRSEEKQVLYCLDWHVAIAAIFYKLFFGYKIAVEYHDPPFRSWKDWMIAHFCDYLLPTTSAMAEYLSSVSRGARKKIAVLPNGIDMQRFAHACSQDECRNILGLPHDKKIVLYSGNIVERKGMHVLADAASFLSNSILVVFIGGTDENAIMALRERAKEKKNVLIMGYRPHEEIPYWMCASDVVVSPNSLDAKTFQDEAAIYWTSPMKIFEYMASRRPIVASDTPAMRELLNERNALLVPSDNPKALAEGIKKILNDTDYADRIVKQAFDEVQNYTWEKRAEKILAFLQRNC